MSIRPSHHNFAGNTQNTSVARMQKMRERFNRWEHKANERKSMFIERQKARIERYRNAFRGSWISKIGLGMVAIWNFITNPPFVVSIEKRATVPFTAMLPFGVRIGKKAKREAGKRKSVTRNRLSPETLEQRQLLAADVFYVDDDFSGSATNDTVSFDNGAGLTASATYGVNAFATIQEAVDAADDGDAAGEVDTINVAPGTYNEEVNIDSSELSLIGAGPSTEVDAGWDVMNNPSGGGFYTIHVSGGADKVIISDLTVTGAYQYGIHTNGPSGISDLTIDSVVAEGNRRTGFDLNRVIGGVVVDSTAQDNDGFGLAISSGSGIELENFTETSNAWGGIGVFPANPAPGTINPSTDFPTDVTFSGTLSVAGGIHVQPKQDPVTATFSVDPMDAADITFPVGYSSFVHSVRTSDSLESFVFVADGQANGFASSLVASGAFTEIYIEDIETDEVAVPPGGDLDTAVTLAASSGGVVSSEVGSEAELDALVASVASLSSPTNPVEIAVDLGTTSVAGASFSVPANVTLVINGGTLTSSSPALEVTAGQVIVENGAILVDDESGSPAVLVSGSVGNPASLTLINSSVSDAAGDAAGDPLFEIGDFATLDLQGTTLTTTVSDAGGTEFITGTAAPADITIDAATTFNIEVAEGSSFAIDLDVKNTGATPSVTTTGTVNGNVAWAGPSTPSIFTYTPLAAVQGPAADSFGFSIPGYSGTINVQITAVNDTPTLTVPDTVTTPITVNEGETTPAITGFVVDDAEPTSVITATLTLDESPDTAAFQGETSPFEDSNDFTDGTLTVTGSGVTDNGTQEVTIVGTAAEVQAILNTLVYTANGDFFGTATVDVEIEDDGAPVESASDSFDITVNNVNDSLEEIVNSGDVINEGQQNKAIRGRIGGVVTGSGGNSGSDLVYGDSETDPVDIVYTVNSVSNGDVTLSGSTTTTFTQQDLDDNLIDFDHDGSEDPTAGFTFTVATADDSETGSYALTVNAVADAPVLDVNDGLTLDQGASETITSADLSFSDNDTNAADLDYTLTSLPSNGLLFLDGTEITTLISFTQEDIDNEDLSYTHDNSENLSDSFGFSLTDGDTTPITGSFAITVENINNPPTVGGDLTVAVSEGDQVTITTSDLSAADVDAGDTDSDLVFTVTGGLANATGDMLLVDGVAASAFTMQDLVDGKVQYQHDGTETTSDSFTFTLSDGEVDPPVSGTFNITINPVNDEQVLSTNAGETVVEEGSVTIGQAALETTDVDSTAAELTYTVASGPSNGQLELTTDPGNSISSFTQAQVNADEVVYNHFGGENLSDSFDFTVNDLLGAATAGTFNITVTPDNDDPTASPVAVTTDEDTEDSISLSGSDDEDGTLDGTSVSIGDVTYSTDNGATFTPIGAAAAGVSYDSVTSEVTLDPVGIALYQGLNVGDDAIIVEVEYTVTDSGSLSADSTATFTVNGLNDDVDLSVADFDVAEGQFVPLTTAEIDATDIDNDDSQITVTVTGYANATGTLRLNGTPLAASAAFTYDELVAGNVDYLDTSFTVGSNTISISVVDPTGTAQTESFTVNVTEVNDPPVLAAGGGAVADFDESLGTPVTVDSGITVADDEDVVTGATVTITDAVDGDVLDATEVGSITKSFSMGVLTLSGTGTAAEYQSVLQSVTFANTGDNPDNFGDALTRSIDFEVNDELSSSNTVDVTVDVTAENDAPVVDETAANDPDPIEYTEGDAATDVYTSVAITDDDSEELSGATITVNGYEAGEDILALGSVTDLSAAMNGDVVSGDIEIDSVTDSGLGTLTVVLIGDAAPSAYAAALASLTYENGSEDPTEGNRSVSFSVDDGSALDNTDASGTATVSVSAVNDAPFVEDDPSPTLAITVNENSGGPSGNFITQAILEAIDFEDDASGLTFTLQSNSRPDLVTVKKTESGDTGVEITTSTGDFTQEFINNSVVAPSPNNLSNRVGVFVDPIGVDAVSGDDSADLTFLVTDSEGGTTTATVTVNIVRTNDNPTRDGSNPDTNSITVDEEIDGTPSVTLLQPSVTYPSLLAFSDEEEASTALNYALQTLPDPAFAVLAIDDVDVPAIDDGGTWVPAVYNETTEMFEIAPANTVFFTGLDIVQNKVAYKHVSEVEPGDTPVGALDFTYRVRDNGVGDEVGTPDQPSQTGTQTFVVTLATQNDSPIAEDDTNAADENEASPVAGNVLTDGTADSDPENDSLIVSAVNGTAVASGATSTDVTLSSGAQVTMLDDGSYTYDPNGSFEWLPDGETTTDSFTYTISDGNGGTDTGTVEVTITGENDGPTANDDDDVAVTAGATVTVNVLANDTDLDVGDAGEMIDGDILSVTAVGLASTGDAVLEMGDVKYAADNFDSLAEGETASDSFTYDISDGEGGTDTATVNLIITGVNDPAEIDATPATISAIEETASTIGGTFTFSDLDNGAVLTVTLAVNSGSLEYTGSTVTATGPAASITLTGTPTEVGAAVNEVNYTGNLDVSGVDADTLTVSVVDQLGAGPAMPTEIPINIIDVNDPPKPDPAFASPPTLQVQQGVDLVIDVVTGADAVETGQTVSLTSGMITGSGGGTLTVSPGTGLVTYEPDENALDGTLDSFTYTLNDFGGTANGGVQEVVVTVDVLIVDVVPDAVDDEFTVDEGVPTGFGGANKPNLFANDISGNPPLPAANSADEYSVVSITDSDNVVHDNTGNPVITLPSGATLKIQPNGGVQYLYPESAGELEEDSFSYTIEDEQGKATGV
ncbi:cadherin-like domain-containing protein [Rhodopirellula europaea]|uniref:cadherin-like domain-containing protein n=1 Tax=Rhodopirellula europaea TaxID=1263866 RepID=UPI003D26E021